MNARRPLLAAAAAALLAAALAAPAGAQVGPTIAAPPVEGLKEGTGAPFPKGGYAELEKLPDWGGVWIVHLPWNREAGQPPPRPAPPQLKGKYLQEYEAWRAAVRANNGVVPRRGSNCLPPGMPGMMGIGQYPIEFIFSPGRITTRHEAWMMSRVIYTDGRPHPEDPEPGFFGHSIGKWEGDTLVVDTVAIKDTVPLGMGVSHSGKLHIVERIRLTGPDQLQVQITAEDPDALATPYVNTINYRRDRYASLLEFVCAENDRDIVGEDGHTESVLAE